MWVRIMQANAACNQVRQCMPSSGSQAQHCQKTYAYCHVYIFKAQAIMGRAKFVVNSFKECRADVRNFSILHSCRAKAVAKTSKNAEEPKLSHQSCRKYIQKCRTAVTKVFGFCICAAMGAPYNPIHNPHSIARPTSTNQTRYLTPKPRSFNLLLSCHL